MVRTIIQTFGDSLSSFVEFLPPGLVLSLLTAYVGQGRYVEAFRQEFVGTLLMVMCTFSAGKWVGKSSMYTAWASHALGVISADYIGGGPQVNPAVTVGMWSLGKVTYTEGFVRIAAQLGGGLIAFPLFHAVAEAYNLEPFGGPEFELGDKNAAIEAFLSEFCATALLMWAIFLLNWEFHFGKYHYIIKQSLTAVAIRALIEFFPTAGPAMNPVSPFTAIRSTAYGRSKQPSLPIRLSTHSHCLICFIISCLVFRCLLPLGLSLGSEKSSITQTILCISTSPILDCIFSVVKSLFTSTLTNFSLRFLKISFVYWISPCLASVLACALYVIYNGGTFFGQTLPIGPLKPKKSVEKGKED